MRLSKILKKHYTKSTFPEPENASEKPCKFIAKINDFLHFLPKRTKNTLEIHAFSGGEFRLPKKHEIPSETRQNGGSKTARKSPKGCAARVPDPGSGPRGIKKLRAARVPPESRRACCLLFVVCCLLLFVVCCLLLFVVVMSRARHLPSQTLP